MIARRVILFVSLLFPSSFIVGASIPVNLPRPEHGLNYKTPATVWDEALPLGNGMIGALVWGDGKPLKISLDRADLWDLRLVPEFYTEEYKFRIMRQWHLAGRVKDQERVYEEPYRRPAPTKIPAGRIELALGGAGKFRETALSLGDALASFALDDGTTARVMVHAVQPVGIITVQGPAVVSPRLVAPAFAGKVVEAARGGIGAGDLTQLGYPAPKESSGQDFQAFLQQGAEGFRFAVYLGWRTTGRGWTGAWSVASSFEGGDPLSLAKQRVEQALTSGFEPMMKTHRQWWESFWKKGTVLLPNPIVERQWFLETYKFGAAARRGAPPITLQAVWTADDGKLPPWKGDYHHDLNTELSYWPCYSGNRIEEGLSYLDYLWNTRKAGFDWTKRFFELPGVNVPMTADLNGNQIGGWRQYTHSATTAAWLAQHFYLHWKYSADREFLKERAYPYLHDSAIFLEAFTAEKGPDGKRTFPLSASPEINDNRPTAWFPTVTNYDLALTRFLFAATAELAEELGRWDDVKRWRKVLGELPEYSLGDDGRLLVAKDNPLRQSHRHFSHLMAIHPLGLIDPMDGNEAVRTIRASLSELMQLGSDWWCGYSFSWLANLAARARDGEEAEKALELFSTAFTLRNSFHCNGDQTGKGYSKFTYRPFTLEGNFAAGAGIQEMLLQSQRDKIQIFPAVPASWKDVSFTTLRAQGAFLVSAERKAGKTTRVEITSEKGGEAVLISPFSGKEMRLRMKPGETQVLLADPPAAAARQSAVERVLNGWFRWSSSEPLVAPAVGDGDQYHSVKDPTIVRHNGRWHIFCTVRGKKRSHQIEYISFTNWRDTGKASRRMLKLTDGYFCAPQVFYFRPHKKWYLIYQVIDKSRKPALQPAWSASADIANQDTWTAPALLFDKEPEGVKSWIDFWIICDDRRAHLFYTGMDGTMWRAETELENFPRGWGKPVLALEGDIFEASHTYRLKDLQKFLTVVEAIGEHGRRYYKAYLADRLDGAWQPIAGTSFRPFASPANVRFAGARWSDAFSHGELIRDGYDETLTVDPAALHFLYQGVTDADREGKPYGEIPWQLGLLTPME